MKIEGNRPGFDPSLERVDPARTAETAATDRSKGSGDQVRMSAEAQLASQVARLVGESSDVRPDAVERAKKLLDAGLVGSDPSALADAMIDSALES